MRLSSFILLFLLSATLLKAQDQKRTNIKNDTTKPAILPMVAPKPAVTTQPVATPNPSSMTQSLPIPKPVVATQPGQPKPVAKINYKEVGSALPLISMITTDNRKITGADMKSKGNLFLMLFNPNCSHCEDETDMLEKNMNLFKKSQLVMVAGNNMKEYLIDFERLHNVRKYSPITIGLDMNEIIDKTFLYTALPQINIYDHDHKLIKIFSGETPIDSLKPYIQ